MTTNVETTSPEADIIDVAQRFLKGRHHRFPVVEGGKLIGQISRQDVLLAVREFAPHEQGPPRV